MSTFRVRLTQGDSRTGDGNLDRIALMTGSITGATNASPIVVTSTAHGLNSGTRVTVQGVGGNTNANADWIITVIDANTFSLNGSSGNSNYTSGGLWRVDSNQRTMYCMGPNRRNRKLRDGDVFTDCNYWKRFCAAPTGSLPLNQAFIELVTDDGSVYIDGQPAIYVVTHNVTVLGNTTYTTTGNTVDVLNTDGGIAQWATISTNQDVNVQLNGNSSTIFTVTGGTSHTFNNGDTQIQTVQFARTSSGSASVVLQVGVLSQCNS